MSCYYTWTLCNRDRTSRSNANETSRAFCVKETKHNLVSPEAAMFCTHLSHFGYAVQLLPVLTNKFTGAWTHYTDTVSGTWTDHWTDHMVENFQKILIELNKNKLTLLLIILFTLVLESDNRLLSPNFRFRLFNQCPRDTAFHMPTSIVRP